MHGSVKPFFSASQDQVLGKNREQTRKLSYAAHKTTIPLKIKQIISPDDGIWVGKRFKLKVELKGSKEAIKSLALLSIRISDPDTDYTISKIKKTFLSMTGKSTYVFKGLKIKDGKPPKDYDIEVVGIKKGHPPLHHDEISDYLILYEQNTITVNSETPGDTTPPELVSFEHSFKNNVVRLTVRVKDDTAVKAVTVYCLMKKSENRWSGGFMHLDYNKDSNEWVLERHLDSERNLAFDVKGSVGMEDTMDNHDIVNALDQSVIYEFQK